MSSEVILDIVIPGEPIPKARPRVIVRNGKAMAFTPKTTAAHEATVRAAIRAEFGLQPLVSQEVSVYLWFYVKNRRWIDIDNRCKTVLDAANKVLWLDDSQVRKIQAELVGWVDEPYTHLIVEWYP